MITKKRIFALIFAIFILMSCLAASIVQVFAWDQTVGDVTYSMSSYQYQGIDQGALPYGYYSWAGLFGYYYQNSGNQYFYFELQNTVNGGLSFAPQAGFNNWDLAYSFDQPGFGVGDPSYRFYLPWNDGNGWDFQIITYDLGNVVYDSSGLTFYRDNLNPSRGFYVFTIDRSILGLSSGWYIYSMYSPSMPSLDPNVVTVNFNYFDENLNFIETVQRNFYSSSNLVEVFIPDIPNYVVQNAAGNGTYYPSDNRIVFSSLTSNQNVSVWARSFDSILSDFEPVKIVFRYYTSDNYVDTYLNETIEMFVPPNLSQNIVVPFPEGYYNANFPSNLVLVTGLLVPGETYSFSYPVISYSDILDESYDFGYDEGYDVGYDEGYDIGYDEGYDEGFRDGGSGTSEPIQNPLLFLTSPVVSFLNIEIYPGLPLGVSFLAAAAVALVVVFLKLFAGG